MMKYVFSVFIAMSLLMTSLPATSRPYKTYVMHSNKTHKLHKKAYRVHKAYKLQNLRAHKRMRCCNAYPRSECPYPRVRTRYSYPSAFFSCGCYEGTREYDRYFAYRYGGNHCYEWCCRY